MQSIEQHYYRETEEQNSNGCKLLVKKDALLDSLDARERSYDNSANGINFMIRKATQGHVSRKSQRLIHERVTRCVTQTTRMGRRDVPGAFLLPLVCIIAIFHIDQVKAEVRLPCGMVKDWFPSGTKPQNSQPPYLLNITDSDGRSVYDDLYMGEPHYGPGQTTYTITLNGTRSGNMTQNFTGFMLYAYNEFDDEDSGDFLSPLPAGVSKRECHFNDTGQFIEVLENSTNSMYWHSIQIKWRSPKKSISGKITISASVVKEDGIFWDGISVTLNHACPMPGCYLPDGCPNGLARNKYGCTICECAGASSVTVGFLSLAVIMFSALKNWI